MRAIVALLFLTGFLFGKQSLGRDLYYIGLKKDAGLLVLVEKEAEKAEVWYVMNATNTGSPPPWRDDIWSHHSDLRYIESEGFFLTTDEEGNISVTKKPTQFSRWDLTKKIAYGDSYSKECRIVNTNAPKGLRYLAVDKTKVAKRLKARDKNDKETEWEAYRLILTADETSGVWNCAATD